MDISYRRRGTRRGAVCDEDGRNNNDNDNNAVEASYEEMDDDPYAHRIGTLATITYTHGDDDVVVGTNVAHVDDPDRPRTRISLILTAVGTGRFRILAFFYGVSSTCVNLVTNQRRVRRSSSSSQSSPTRRTRQRSAPRDNA